MPCLPDKTAASRAKAASKDPLQAERYHQDVRQVPSGPRRKSLLAGSIAAAVLVPLAALAQEAPFMGAGTWEVAALRNSQLTLSLQLDSVTPQGVTGTITGSSVEPTRIVVRSLNAESGRVPSECDRTLTFFDTGGKIIVVIDGASGHGRMKVKRRPSNWFVWTAPAATPP
jgi:hypothetical protein